VPALSTLLGWSAICVSLAAVVSLFPASLVSGAQQKASALHVLQLVLNAGAVLWLFAGVSILWAIRLARGSQLLRGTAPVSSEARTPVASELEGIEVRLRGDPTAVADHGGPLHVTPVAVLAVRERRIMPTVIVPALLWKRFHNHPQALRAVLAHEAAHFRQRDLFMLYGARDFAVTAIAILFAGIAASLAVSVRADMGNGPFQVAALQAALIGKSYLVVCLLAVFAAVPFLGILTLWREALADRFAEERCGEQALREAVGLIEASDGHGEVAGRASPEQRRKALVLGRRETFLAGIVAAALGGYLAGNLIALYAAFVNDAGPQGELAVPDSAIVFQSLLTFVAPLAVLLPSMVAASADHGAPARTAWSGLLFCAGWTAGWLLTQALPMVLASTAMPDGFDYVMRAYPAPLLLSSTADALATSAGAALLAIASLYLATRRGNVWLAVLPPLAWVALSSVEAVAFPVTRGMLAVGGTLVALALLFLRGGAPVPSRAGAALPTGLLVVVAAIGWAGFAGDNHIATSLAAAGNERRTAKDLAGAIELYSLEAAYSRFHSAPKLRLAEALLEAKDLRRASVEAQAAAEAPYASAWPEVFKARVLAGELQLTTRSEADLALAERNLSAAELMWRQNSRLPLRAVAGMLYNSACLGQLQGRPQAYALSRLLEAWQLDRELGRAALDDEDLKSLGLRNAVAPSNQAIAKAKKLSMSAPAWEDAVRSGLLSVEDLRSIVGILLQQPVPKH
jgi:hypothetical protein